MWQPVKLADVCLIQSGNSIAAKKKTELFTNVEGIPYVATKDVGFDGAIDYDNGIYIPHEHLSSFKISPSGATLVCAEGGSAGRKIAFSTHDCCYVNKLFSITPGESLEAKYVYYYTLSGEFQSQFKAALHGLIGGVSLNKIKDFTINVPPLAEQRRIVAKLDAAFAEIDDAANASFEQAKNAKSLFESLRAALLCAESENWEEKNLGDCCSRVSVGHVGSTSEHYCAEDQGIPFLRSQNVKPARLELGGVRHITTSFHEKLKKSRLQANDILIVRVGANRGDCCLVPDTVGELNCANIVFARPTAGYPAFLAHFCQSTIGRQRLLGMTTGAAQGVINTKAVATLRIPFPPLQEQKSIATKLDTIYERTIELERLYLDRAHQTRLLKSAFLSQEFNQTQSDAA